LGHIEGMARSVLLMAGYLTWSGALCGCGEKALQPGQDGDGPLPHAAAAGAAADGGSAVAGAAGSFGVAGQASGGAGSGGSVRNPMGGGSAVGGTGGPPGLDPVFVAQGHHGRITVSCDDGQSFPHNHSQADSYRCFEAGQDCDHSEFAGRGLAYGAGAFVATWGWGYPGALQRTTTATTWTDVMTKGPNFADIAYGNDKFVACGNPTQVSQDGVTWQAGGDLTFDFNYRGIEFVPAGGGTFVVSGESGEQRAVSYSRDGKTWQAPSTSPALCGQELRGIAGSEDVILIASAKGHVCVSTDAGENWTQQDVSERFTSPPLWTGSEFWIYAGSTLWRSRDGKAWTSQSIAPNNITIGSLARSPAGTLVAANDGWQVWYEKQRLFRSTDGVNWTVLDESKFTGSHPINFISFGYAAPSANCGTE